MALEALHRVAKQRPELRGITVTMTTRNRSVLQAIFPPARQSGQQDLKRIYAARVKLKALRIEVVVVQLDTDKRIKAAQKELKQ
jgi:hypothetical protein